MKPSTQSVQQLFEQAVRYVVPLYQRPYVWDEERQWAPLWDDVSALLAHQEGEGLTGLWSHFLGALVLDQERTAPGQIPRYTVIDGQQRLTTLQILLAAAAHSMAKVGVLDDSTLLRELIINNPLKAKGNDQLKVWPTNSNRQAFQAVMTSPDPGAVHITDDTKITAAFVFFAERTLEYITAVDEQDIPDEDAVQAAQQSAETELAGGGAHTSGAVIERCQRLRITLCDLLKVVSISLEADDNAQVIFETLNARGTPLLALDLVKNAVFLQLSQGSPESSLVDDLYTEVWQPVLEQQYWREERRQGRLFRPAGELFLMHWLALKLERVIPATELFPTFRQYILGPGSDADALTRELCADATTMRSFDNLPFGTPEAEFFHRFDALDAGTALPAVLLLFRSNKVTPERRRRALRILESWLARRALMRLTAKNYNRIIPRLVALMKKDLAHADDALLQGLSGGEGEISRWPTDKEFKAFIRNYPVYGIVGQKRLVMALAAVESSLYSTKTDAPHLATDMSLEHLMPQRWEQHWPLTDPSGGSVDATGAEQLAAARASRLHRLGNLTIVTGPMNAALSNGPWPDKRAALNAESKLLLNVPLVGSPRWDTDTIDERGEWLADRLAAIWPGPAFDGDSAA